MKVLVLPFSYTYIFFYIRNDLFMAYRDVVVKTCLFYLTQIITNKHISLRKHGSYGLVLILPKI